MTIYSLFSEESALCLNVFMALSKSSFLLSALYLLSFSSYLYAQSVYSWKDEKGVVHYSTNPQGNPGAKSVKLPTINKADVKVSKQEYATCHGRGGIDCQAGADGDGSVICYDGFKEAIASFSKNCNSPKLEVSQVSEVNKSGSFTVIVRNTKSVEAQGPTLEYAFESGKKIPLQGPATIAPFGIGEFRFVGNESYRAPLSGVKEGELFTTCANC